MNPTEAAGRFFFFFMKVPLLSSFISPSRPDPAPVQLLRPGRPEVEQIEPRGLGLAAGFEFQLKGKVPRPSRPGRVLEAAHPPTHRLHIPAGNLQDEFQVVPVRAHEGYFLNYGSAQAEDGSGVPLSERLQPADFLQERVRQG